jgi:hypothetical protein
MFLSLFLGFPKFSTSNVTSFQLLVAGAILLGVASLMQALARERRISIKRSVVSDELAIHLARIADALEHIGAKNNNSVHLASGTPENSEAQPASEQPQHVMFSMFGR